MNRHLSRSLLLLVAAMLATANLTYGQTAEVTGRVTDRNTAVAPGTEVSISSVETGVSRKAVTNDEGYYTIRLLQPGAYQLTVRKEGFKPVARDNVALEVGQTARLDFTLEAGNVNEVLNIVEQTPLLSQETSSLGQVIDGKKITNIPLNGRSPFRLVQLTPGVLGSNSANGQFGDIPVNTTFDSNFSINGGRSQSNEVTIDGVPLAFSAAITGGGNRPNWTGASAKLDSDRPRGEQILRWFDTGVQLNPALPCAAPANFCQPPAFSFGNAPRTFSGLRGPSYRNVDFPLIKVTRISETVNLQFRSEFFNVFNIANFALPNTNINNQQYGQITATSALPRVIQFALKLGF